MATLPSGASLQLDVRLEFLAKAQNPDGGWGYFPGKQSWLEPTAWATLAFHGSPAADRAWQRILAWQAADGSWRAGPDVHVSSWATALCVTLSQLRGEFGEPYKKGLHWLLATKDAESTAYYRALKMVGFDNGRDPAHVAWPWKPGDSSWIEPTAHALVALKFAQKRLKLKEIDERIQLGEAAILDQRCQDGGWNYGNRKTLGVFLPSYPETTAVALVGLQGRDSNTLKASLDKAEALAADRQGRIASAWLSIALQVHGLKPPASRDPELATNGDLLVTALEAIGAPGGTCRRLQIGGNA